MAVLGPDPAEPGRCGSPWGPLRGPVHGARARTVVRRCSRHASYGFLPSVAGPGPCPTARPGPWPEAAFAATADRACRVGGRDAARGSPSTAARAVARRRAARPDLRLSFGTHLRYNEPDRLFPFPHRLVHAASASGGWAMTFEEILDQAIAMLQRRGRLTYSTLKRQFQLDEAALEDLKNELIEGQRLAVDERGNVLVWTGEAGTTPTPSPSSAYALQPALQEVPPPPV